VLFRKCVQANTVNEDKMSGNVARRADVVHTLIHELLLRNQERKRLLGRQLTEYINI
jgi:hypothetical protein